MYIDVLAVGKLHVRNVRCNMQRDLAVCFALQFVKKSIFISARLSVVI